MQWQPKIELFSIQVKWLKKSEGKSRIDGEKETKKREKEMRRRQRKRIRKSEPSGSISEKVCGFFVFFWFFLEGGVGGVGDIKEKQNVTENRRKWRPNTKGKFVRG